MNSPTLLLTFLSNVFQGIIEVVTTAKLITDVVTAASQVSAASATISAAKPSIPAAAPTVVAAYTRRRKGVIIRDPEKELSLKTSTENPAETPKICPIFQARFDENTRFLFKSREEMKEEDQEIIKSINETPAQKAAKRRKLSKEAQEAKDLRKHLEVVDDKDDDVFVEATPLARKVPVVDYQIVLVDNKPRFKIIKADETHQLYISFTTLLKNFDREDLENLWGIVKKRFSTSKPTNFSNEYILLTLKTMLEKPDEQYAIWKNQRSVHGLALKISTFKVQTGTIGECHKTLSRRRSEMSLELLRVKIIRARVKFRFPFSGFRDPFHPNIPYPSRMYKQKQQDKDEVQIYNFWQMFKQLYINITLADALILIPKYRKMLKALLSNKEKLLELANTPLNEDCSAVILKKLPEKLGDPRKFLILCGFNELKCKALADLGASINLMPLSVWKKLGLPELISTHMTLELANRAICTPARIARDVFVSVGKFTFPADFVIVDYESDPIVPLILGRPFLRIAHSLIDVHKEEMILRDGDERLTLNMRHDTSIYSNQPQKESINMINICDNSSEDFLEKLFTANHQSGNLTFSSHPELTSPEVKNNVFDPD
nr:reverse transcriptase domain-containing protein [Tanacetum cinerariifolium]